MARESPTLARWLLAATVLTFGAVVLRDALGVVSPVLPGAWTNAYYATEMLAVAACALRTVRTARGERGPWFAITLGLFGFAAGDIYYAVALSGLDAPPFPSPADVGYLSIYPAAYAGLLMLLRARSGRVSPILWLDGLITAFAAAGLGAALVFGVVAETDGSLATVATNLAYPLGDLSLLAFVLAVVTVSGWEPGRTWVLIALGFAIFAVADTVYLYETAVGTYREWTILDVGWPAAYVLLAFAAWQPPRRLDARRLHGPAMLVLPAASSMVAVGLLVVDHYARLQALAVWLASASLAVVSIRFALTFRENVEMLRASELEATTDPLTGLGNRRALMDALANAAADAVEDAPHVLALFDLDGFKSYNDAFGHPAGDALLERLGANLAATMGGRGRAYRMGGDEFCILARLGRGADGDAIAAEAAVALSDRGERFQIGCSYGTVVIDAAHTDASDALRRADQRMYANKGDGRRTSVESIHRVLLGVVGEHDGALRNHVNDVARLADRVGRELGLDAEDMAHLRRAAELHDIGKVAIPDAILHAPRPLEPEEWEYMHQHTVIGARIISAAPELLPVAEIVRSSHERFDGAGYPDRLAGDEIPLAARIVAVCDSFDAMTTTRAYRDAMSVEDATAELVRCSGTQFDPRVVDVFLGVLFEDELDAGRVAPAVDAASVA